MSDKPGSPTRIYLVASGESKTLVEAISPAQALRDVVRGLYTVTIPSSLQAQLAGAGVPVLRAGVGS